MHNLKKQIEWPRVHMQRVERALTTREKQRSTQAQYHRNLSTHIMRVDKQYGEHCGICHADKYAARHRICQGQ